MSRLYLKLFVWFTGANLLTLVITVLVSARIAEHGFAVVQPEWPLVAQASVQSFETGGVPGLAHWAERLQRRGIDIALFDDGHNLVPFPPPPPLAEFSAELQKGDEVVLHPRPDLTVAAITVEGTNGAPLRFYAVRHPRPPSHRPAMLIGVQVLVSALVIGVFGWIAARGISRPVAAVQAAARRVAQGDLGARVGSGFGARYLGARDELGQLARDFDSMAERIQASVEQTRGLLQDVSHELRSPLARLQLAVELAKRDLAENGAARTQLERAQREVGRLDRIIGEVLALARLEAQLPQAGFERIALDALATKRVHEVIEQAETRRVRLQLDTVPVTVEGDGALLVRAIDNLLDNAIKFSPPDSLVELRTGIADDAAELCVLDRGPGVASDELPLLFRPFHRGANSPLAEGQGLGLAIVRRIAQTHKGEVAAESREGGGLIVRLRLPLAKAPVKEVD
jgi:signal transduction histidine kinase